MDIRLINLDKRYYSTQGHYIEALKGINLDINYQGYVALVGPTGSGKSTLLNVLTGILRPSSGEVFWGKLCLNRATDREINEMKRNHFGIVFQDSRFIRELTVEENIFLPLVINAVNPKTKKEYYKNLIKKMHIDHLVARYPDQLSGGEKRKVSIVRALIGNPEILIADEPTANLDREISDEVFRILTNLNQLGLTILVATHDERFASYAKETYFMEEGRIIRFKSR